MAQFIKSKEMISSGFNLWNDKRTQLAVEDTYDIKIWPVSNIKNDSGPINFVVKPQIKGLLANIDVVSRIRILNNGKPINTVQKKLSVVNNFADSLWTLVSITMDDRTELMQSMKNAYAYSCFFNHALNTQQDHGDYLLYNEMFKMDTGNKQDLKAGHEFAKSNLDPAIQAALEASLITINNLQPGTTDEANAKNHQQIALNVGIDFLRSLDPDDTYFRDNVGAAQRAQRINIGQSVTLSAKLQCPLINTSNFLPSKIGFRISLTQNSDDFLLYTPEAGYSVELEDVYLLATYHQPRDPILKWMNDELIKTPAKYYVSNPEIIIKPIQSPGQVIRITDIFHKIPEFAFFCLQNSKDYEGDRTSNPYAFIKYKKFQFYRDGSPLFVNELDLSMNDNGEITEYGEYLRQLYETVGKDLKGNCLINSENFPLHFMTGVSFTADRSNTTVNYMNLQDTANTYLNIDMGINEPPQDMILIVYAIYNRKIEIDSSRSIKIIE